MSRNRLAQLAALNRDCFLASSSDVSTDVSAATETIKIVNQKGYGRFFNVTFELRHTSRTWHAAHDLPRMTMTLTLMFTTQKKLEAQARLAAKARVRADVYPSLWYLPWPNPHSPRSTAGWPRHAPILRSMITRETLRGGGCVCGWLGWDKQRQRGWHVE